MSCKVLRIRDVNPGSRFQPGSEFFHPRARIPDPHKKFKYLTQKMVSKHSEIWSGFIPDPDFLPITDPESRSQKRHQIPVPDPQHWSCIDPSVRIVTKSPKVGPLLIFSISLVCPSGTFRSSQSREAFSDPDIFVIDLEKANKKLIFNKSFSAYYFLKVHRDHFSFFKDKKSKRSHKTVGMKVLLDIFAWW